MLDWRTPIAELRYQILDAKNKGIKEIPVTHIESVINAIESNLALIDKYDMLREGSKNVNEEKEDEVIRYLDKFSSALAKAAERHKNYTQLIISAGYAAYFGLWSIAEDLVKNSSDEKIHLMKISVVYALISVVFFIMFEVIRVGIEGYEIQIRNDVLLKVKLENHKNFKRDSFDKIEVLSQYAENIFHGLWCWFYPISVFFGLGAIGLLFAALLK